jgi:hypothetical protein
MYEKKDEDNFTLDFVESSTVRLPQLRQVPTHRRLNGSYIPITNFA